MKHSEIRKADEGVQPVSSSSESTTSELFSKLHDLSLDPERIDEFLKLAASPVEADQEATLSDMLISSLTRLRDIEEDDQFRNHCNFEVHSDRFACFILENREEIVASNQLARERFGIRASTPITDLDFVGIDGQPFADIVVAALENQPVGNKLTPIAQAYSPKMKRRLDVAVLHLHVCSLMGITKEIILICDAITPSTLDLFAQNFGLTPAEASIVERFSAGQSIPEIAENRVRSVATVKTQFYKILEKCGAGSQGELLQMVARIESLNAATSAINEEFSHPHRRNFTIMRPGNRTLDVVSAGKPDGRPVLSCNSLLFRTFPAWMEEELYQHNIKLYSIAPPGSGKTTPPLEGETLEECFAKDVTSLLDNIGAKAAVLVGSGTSFPLCLRTASIIPDRVSALFSTSVIPSQNRTQGNRKRGLLASIRHLTLGDRTEIDDAVSGALFRIVTQLGVERYTRLVTSHHRASMEALVQPANLDALKMAFDASMAQGVELNTQLLTSSLTDDWETDLAVCPTPVHFAIGEHDAVGAFDVLEAIANDYPDRVTLTKVEGGTAGYPLLDPEAFFGALDNAIERA